MVLNVPRTIQGHTYQQRTPQPNRDKNCNNEFRVGNKKKQQWAAHLEDGDGVK